MLVALGTSFLAWRGLQSSAAAPRPLMRLDVDLGSDALLGSAYGSGFANISPDGTRLVYPARGPGGKQMLATRLLNTSTVSMISGTDGGFDPFFSPDGRWVGFFADGTLKKVPVAGGPMVNLAAAANPRGASWGEDGTIVAELINSSGLSLIPAAGGAPQILTKIAAGEVTPRWPQFLPGGKAVLFTVSRHISEYEGSTIEMVDLKTGARQVVQQGGYYGRYSPSGHLFYVHEGVIYAVPVGELTHLKPAGGPVAVVEDVASGLSSGSGQFAFSQTGVFIYRTGKSRREVWSLGLFDSAGAPQPLGQLSRREAYFTPRFAPDGRRLALSMDTSGRDTYVYDFQSDVLTRLSFGENIRYEAIWTPDGRHLLVRSSSAGNVTSLKWIRSDGSSGGGMNLIEGNGVYLPCSFSPDGRILAYEELGGSGFDIWTTLLDLTDPEHPKAGKPQPFARATTNEASPVFSPDGRWIAYQSDESGAMEIYVRPFPENAAGGKWQISSGGGRLPKWPARQKRVYFENSDNRIMAADYSINGDSFVPGKPRLWSETVFYAPTRELNYDISPDGARIVGLLLPVPEDAKGSVHATFLLNILEELRRRTGK